MRSQVGKKKEQELREPVPLYLIYFFVVIIYNTVSNTL